MLPKPETSFRSLQISGKYFIPKHWRTPRPAPRRIQVRALGCIRLYKEVGGCFCSPWGSGSPFWGLGTGPTGSSIPGCDGDVPAGLCSEACLCRRSHCDSPPLLRAGSAGKSKALPSKKVTEQLSKSTTRSLGDLKVCRGTRGLMARFLQRPKRSAEGPGHSSQGHKQVGSSGTGAAPPLQGAPSTPSSSLCSPSPHQPFQGLFPCHAPHGVGTPAPGRGCDQSFPPVSLSLPSPPWRDSSFP